MATWASSVRNILMTSLGQSWFIWSKRVLCMKVFKEGMSLCRLPSILFHSPAACKPFCVKSLTNDVTANYLTWVLHPQYTPESLSRWLIGEKMVDHVQEFSAQLRGSHHRLLCICYLELWWRWPASGHGKLCLWRNVSLTRPYSFRSNGWLTCQQLREISAQVR